MSARRWSRPRPEAEPAPGLFDPPLSDPTAPVPGKVGAEHPVTAIEASHLVAPRAASQRARVLDLLYDRGLDGATAAEAAEHVGTSRNQVAARLLELREGGWARYLPGVGDEPAVRSTGGRFTGAIHVLTPNGRNAWKDHR